MIIVDLDTGAGMDQLIDANPEAADRLLEDIGALKDVTERDDRFAPE